MISVSVVIRSNKKYAVENRRLSILSYPKKKHSQIRSCSCSCAWGLEAWRPLWLQLKPPSSYADFHATAVESGDQFEPALGVTGRLTASR